MKEAAERICVLCWTQDQRRTLAFRRIESDDLCRAHILTEGYELTDGDDILHRGQALSKPNTRPAPQEEYQSMPKPPIKREPCIYPGCEGTHKVTSKLPYCSDCTLHNRHKLKAEVARREGTRGGGDDTQAKDRAAGASGKRTQAPRATGLRGASEGMTLSLTQEDLDALIN